MDKYENLKEEIKKLKKENEELKKSLDFYMASHYHIGEINFNSDSIEKETLKMKDFSRPEKVKVYKLS